MNQKITNNNISYNINDVTIIMEGVLRYVDIIEICESYMYLCKQIIISSYIDKELIKKIKKKIPNVLILNSDIHMVRSKTMDIYYKNKNWIGKVHKGCEQFHHMYNSLPLVTTKYVVKTRVDQLFSNFNYFIEMVVNTNKVIMFPLYVRGSMAMKYHAGDMLFGCSTEKMKSIWYNNHNINVKSRLAEPAVWRAWMDSQAHNMNLKQINEMSHVEYGSFCAKLFIIFDEEKLRPYSIKNQVVKPNDIDIPLLQNFRFYNKNISNKKNTFKYFSSKGCDITCPLELESKQVFIDENN